MLSYPTRPFAYLDVCRRKINGRCMTSNSTDSNSRLLSIGTSAVAAVRTALSRIKAVSNYSARLSLCPFVRLYKIGVFDSIVAKRLN